MALDDLVRILAALDNPHRLRIIALLAGERLHVSGLARQMGLSRPLVHMHLKRLEAAGMLRGSLELSTEGKAMKYFEVIPFSYCLTPDLIREAIQANHKEKEKN